MSYLAHKSNNSIQAAPPPAASPVAGSAKLWIFLAAFAVLATSFSTVAVSQPATGQSSAQIEALDPDLCATTYRANDNHGGNTEADCRTIVAWRNQVVSNPNSVIGANHPLAQWGSGNQTAINTWSGLGLYTEDSQDGRVITKIELPEKNMAGPLPGKLPFMRFINLQRNLLSGGLPNWIYGASDLRYLNLGTNRLSGTITGSAFSQQLLWAVLLENNLFSGSVPNFNFDNLPALIDLRLSNNKFEGPFPASYSGLADGRGVDRLQFHDNKITGDLPVWVLNLTFANEPTWGGVRGWHIVSFFNNRLCLPSNFQAPEYEKLDGQDPGPPVSLQIMPQICPKDPTPVKNTVNVVENLQFEPVDANGNPTSENPVGLKVAWSKPRAIGTAQQYTVRLRLFAAPNNIVDGRVPRYLYCLPEHIRIPTPTQTSPGNFEVTITRSHCDSIPSQHDSPLTLFDPKKYVAYVSTGAWSRKGTTWTNLAEASPLSDTWSIYIADDAQKTYGDVISVLGSRDVWLWDAANQIWQKIDTGQPSLDSYYSLSLEPGSSLSVESRVPISWLPLAGLSTADADTPVQFQNGWNVISAGGSVTRGANEEGAFFIDDSLIDCSSANGAIAILRNVAGTQRFDIELPCHPGREALMTRGQAFRTIGEINELDTLFIYFRSVLPVTVRWDADNSRYAPAS